MPDLEKLFVTKTGSTLFLTTLRHAPYCEDYEVSTLCCLQFTSTMCSLPSSAVFLCFGLLAVSRVCKSRICG